jgi:hypothetical protein
VFKGVPEDGSRNGTNMEHPIFNVQIKNFEAASPRRIRMFIGLTRLAFIERCMTGGIHSSYNLLTCTV